MSSGTVAESFHAIGPFETEVADIMRGLRGGFLGLIEALPETIRRAADLERALKLSTTLAWQVHRVATSPNPLAVAADVPGAAAVKQVLRAARARGVDGDSVKRAAQAMDAFEGFIARHAGDRATFLTMINSLVAHEVEGIDIKTRRQAFRLNSQVWGVQVKTMLSCGIYRPGANSSVFEILSLRGSHEIRRLRAGAPFRLSSQQLTDATLHAMDSRAIDSAEAIGPELLREFCTQPCPELENRIEGGCVHSFLQDTPLGNAGVQTLYLADVTRDVGWEMPPGEPNNHLKFAAIMKPVEALVLDALIYKGMFGRLDPRVTILGSLDRLGEPDPLRFRTEDKLPIHADVHNLGVGLAALPTPHVPRYAEMVELACRRVGWDPEQFEVFRCVVEYPLLSSVVCVRFDLPDTANW